jgi:anthraniloyl-CoA monooxygenase
MSWLGIDAEPNYGPMFQVPFADKIRHETGIPGMTVDAVLGADPSNTILAAGRAAPCAMARPHLPVAVPDARCLTRVRLPGSALAAAVPTRQASAPDRLATNASLPPSAWRVSWMRSGAIHPLALTERL